MRTKLYIIALAGVVTVAIGMVAYAHGPGGGSAGVSMMGGGGMGMKGGHMRGYGQKILDLFKQLFYETDDPDQKDTIETDALRRQIQEKRIKLYALILSHNPDKNLIGRRIEELNQLEYELDKKYTGMGASR
jgi:Spy/CpxP family protein refolding chaperone